MLNRLTSQFHGYLERAIRGIVSQHQSSARPACTYIGNGLVLVRTRWGGEVVVPGYNVDVSVGLIRDQIHEPWTTRLIQELLKSGDAYCNVGANFGYYTVLGAKIVGSTGSVVSIEANAEVFAILMKSIYYAGVPDVVELYNVAASIRSGDEVTFSFDYQFIGGGHINYIGDPIDSSSFFWDAATVPQLLDASGKWVKGRGLMKTFVCRTASLDEIYSGKTVDLIHCDAEHAEPFVLLGAASLISRSPNCKIVFEWSSYAYRVGTETYRAAVLEMWDFLSRSDFSIRHLKPLIGRDGGISVSPRLTLEDFLAGDHGDYIAVRRTQDPWGE